MGQFGRGGRKWSYLIKINNFLILLFLENSIKFLIIALNLFVMVKFKLLNNHSQ